MMRGAPLAACALTLALAMQCVYAQTRPGDYPNKPVRLVAASAPGGGIDIIGRVIAQRLSETWNQQVVVDNRAGGGGVIATGIVAKSLPDGYTLLVQSVGVAYVQTLHKDAPFDVLRDLTPIAKVASQPSLLAVHASVPVATLPELIKLAKAKPGQLSFGTGGAGGASHMGTELFAHAANIKLVHVPYKGTGPSMTALISGEVEFSFANIPSSLNYVEQGRLRAIAITSAKRSGLLPKLPTMIEAGLPGFETSTWYGLLAPAGVSQDIVTKLNRTVNAAVKSPDVNKRLAALGADPVIETPQFFADYLKAEVERWAKVVKASGATPE